MRESVDGKEGGGGHAARSKEEHSCNLLQRPKQVSCSYDAHTSPYWKGEGDQGEGKGSPKSIPTEVIFGQF